MPKIWENGRFRVFVYADDDLPHSQLFVAAWRRLNP